MVAQSTQWYLMDFPSAKWGRNNTGKEEEMEVILESEAPVAQWQSGKVGRK